MRNALSLLVLAVSLGCAPRAPLAQSGPGAGGEPALAPATWSPRVPLTAEWIVQSEAPGRLTLVARVNRAVPLAVPTTVTVTVPLGVRVLSGKTSWVIDASDSTGPVDEVLVLEVQKPEGQEIVLAADAAGSNFGVHAKKVHSLGKPARQAPASPAPGAPLNVGGHDFGPSVPAKP